MDSEQIKKKKKVRFDMDKTVIFDVPTNNDDRIPDTEWMIRKMRFDIRCRELETLLEPLLRRSLNIAD